MNSLSLFQYLENLKQQGVIADFGGVDEVTGTYWLVPVAPLQMVSCKFDMAKSETIDWAERYIERPVIHHVGIACSGCGVTIGPNHPCVQSPNGQALCPNCANDAGLTAKDNG